MKAEAFICDFKNHLVLATGIVGINPVEDLFDQLASFPTIFQLHKTNIHYCTECYNEHVLRPAAMLIDRKKDERFYELKVKELAYSFRSTTVRNFWQKTRNKSTGHRKNTMKKSS